VDTTGFAHLFSLTDVVSGNLRLGLIEKGLERLEWL
jgi:hypothetical protein